MSKYNFNLKYKNYSTSKIFTKTCNINNEPGKTRDVTFITFKNLNNIEFINHGFSTRLGGVSKEHLSSMNLSFSRGDDEENVFINYGLIAEAIGFNVNNVVASHQTHTTNVLKVTSDNKGMGIFKDRDYSDIDGLVTKEPGVVLATFYADCVPLYIVDTKNKAIGLSHSGWRGTVNRMGLSTLNKMKECFGTNPEDVVVAVGPSICVDCYEVSEDVATEFQKEFEDTKKIVFKKDNGKYQLDLWQANKQIFIDAGVHEENISLPDLCTCCNSDFLYSHRASKGMRGNLAAFLTIKE